MNKEIKINQIVESTKRTVRVLREKGHEIFLRGSLATLLSVAPASAVAVLPNFLGDLNKDNGHVLQVENPWGNDQEVLANAEGLTKKAIQLERFQVLAISGQKIRVAGVDINVNPEQNPGQRATVVVVAKDDLTVNVEFGTGTFSGLFKLSPDMGTLLDNANTVLAVQSSRNDLPGNCLPAGCTEGTREALFVAYVNANGKVVFEPGVDRMRLFTGAQLQLPEENISYLGEAQYVEQSSLTAQSENRGSFQEKIRLGVNQVLTISAQKINAAGVNIDVNPEKFPGKRATVAIVAKNDLVVEIQHGEGVFEGLFQLENDPGTLLDNANTVLAVQSSRNDLPGNCLPAGCTEGTREALFVAYVNANGKVVFEPGVDRMRPFTGAQLSLPNNIAYLGQVNK